MHLAGVGGVLAHLVLDAADAIAGLFGLDDEAADAPLAEREIGRGEHQATSAFLPEVMNCFTPLRM